MQDRKPIDLEGGWSFMQVRDYSQVVSRGVFQAYLVTDTGWSAAQDGIMKLRKLLEGESAEQFTAEQYMMLYTLVTLPSFAVCNLCALHSRMLSLVWPASTPV